MVILAGQWEVIEKLSEGTFGQVFSALNIRTNTKVAVKLNQQQLIILSWNMKEICILVYSSQVIII